MLLIKDFPQILAQLEKEKGLDKTILIKAIEESLAAATKKELRKECDVTVELDDKTGEATVFFSKTVVEQIEDPVTQITLDEAREYQDDAQLGDAIFIDDTPEVFGRIAVQTAKQVVLQKIREAEKNSISEEFSAKVNSIITATVQRKEGRNYLLNLGRTEAILDYKDQIPGERYNAKDQIKVFVVSVDSTPRGPKIRVSRTHSGLIRVLFETEVPEINDKIIEVVAVAREPGSRAKVAVKSNDPEVGAVGTCVGHMGGRIHNIVKALGNEKIDIIEWGDDPMELIAAALKPAKINKIRLEENSGEDGALEKKAFVFVDEDQLSLAIGRGGQNVRLASKLTGWNIDIQEEKSSFAENLAKAAAEKQPDENETSEKSSLAENLKAAIEEAKAEEAKAETTESSETAEADKAEQSVLPDNV
ncbi:transcription termination/antitermination protein NusA [Candidatus Termititenax persephonae]|uniref:Transcription termination/antitermination protein NusA n=1 Tax=Candidatus Termititenax persephonae TaxID=2218525 RepID=A0A388TFB0_9BACT|nr:transcription termination/antitermination protein NusA [Candidatus Termititenax persephonae]